MKILVVDDTRENLEAAKIAAQEFPQHNFNFLASASETLKQVKKHDFFILDLMFFEEPSIDLIRIYKIYLLEIKKHLKKNIEFIKEGTKGFHATKGEEIFRLENGKISLEFLRMYSAEKELSLLEDWLIKWGGYLCEEASGDLAVERLFGNLIKNYKSIPRQYPFGIPLLLEVLRSERNGTIQSDMGRHGIFLQGAGLLMQPIVEYCPKDFEKISTWSGKLYFEPKFGFNNENYIEKYNWAARDKEEVVFWRKIYNKL